ncbi:dynein heavy chain 4 [Dorcoceras hygrometricum]|uniref:Dynein heavy chain 4 n=1 Tax=Dorcoceras hygrometricum TaxID=472368 RepID=A0A2Z7B643_9LAMI|nr:dynein heavy chain 4 [Dorcoceras hygrometricum]
MSAALSYELYAEIDFLKSEQEVKTDSSCWVLCLSMASVFRVIADVILLLPESSGFLAVLVVAQYKISWRDVVSMLRLVPAGGIACMCLLVVQQKQMSTRVNIPVARRGNVVVSLLRLEVQLRVIFASVACYWYFSRASDWMTSVERHRLTGGSDADVTFTASCRLVDASSFCCVSRNQSTGACWRDLLPAFGCFASDRCYQLVKLYDVV